jgi:hypothetical protein
LSRVGLSDVGGVGTEEAAKKRAVDARRGGTRGELRAAAIAKVRLAQ